LAASAPVGRFLHGPPLVAGTGRASGPDLLVAALSSDGRADRTTMPAQPGAEVAGPKPRRPAEWTEGIATRAAAEQPRTDLVSPVMRAAVR
jgi:hypothetical protein